MAATKHRQVSLLVTVMLLLLAMLAGALPITRAPAKATHGLARAQGRYATQKGARWIPVGRVARSVRQNRDRPVSHALRQTSGSVQSNAQLALPASAFPPDLGLLSSVSNDPATLDGTLFAALHTKSYSDLGALGGWFQYYSKNMSDGLFDDVYLGSYYPTTDAARTAFADIHDNLVAHGTSIPCSSGDQCYEVPIAIAFPDGVYLSLLRVVQSSNALAETSAAVPAADFTALQTSQQADLDLLSNAFVNIVGVTPPTPTRTAVPTVPPTSTPTPIATPTATSTATQTATATATATATTIPAPPGLSVKVSGIPRAGHTGTLRVLVRSQKGGQPVAHARVSLDGRAVGIGSVGHGVTNSQGRAAFTGFHPTHAGRATIQVTDAGFVSRTVHVTVRS